MRRIWLGKSFQVLTITLIKSISLLKLFSQLAKVSAMDNAVGKIIESLRENGLYENSIIVFTSDVSNHFLLQISLLITFLFFVVEWRHSSSWRKQLSTSRNEKYYLGGRYSRGCIYSCPIYSKQARRNLQQVSELHFLHLQYKTTCLCHLILFHFTA